MVQVRQLHETFAGELRQFDASGELSERDVIFVRDQLDRYGVVVFRDQQGLTDEGLLAFTRRFGRLHTSITTHRKDLSRRLANDELSDISNINATGEILPQDDARRLQQRANLIWHTDNSFRTPGGAYTLLAARLIPPEGGETEFADTRAAYDALPGETKARIEGLEVEHSLAHSRLLAGTGKTFESEEKTRFPGRVQPLVRVQERTGRRALYIGSHAAGIVGWSHDAGRALLDELLAFATQPRFVYRHRWIAGDLVMWDNRVTLHRALPFDDRVYRRDLRRTSTIPDDEVAL